MKTQITPGKLYTKLSAAFRQHRGAVCGTCILPTPVLLGLASEGQANWTLAPLARDCSQCSRVVDELIRRFQSQYELFDPTATPPFLQEIAASRPGRPH